jgi:alanine racemase
MAERPARIPVTRRRFLATCAATAPALVLPACAAAPAAAGAPHGARGDGFDPWLEIVADGFRHNVRETAKLAGGTPILAVIKNNAYGLGDQVVGPIVAACPEVVGLATVRVVEVLALRDAGVQKPILNMAETSAGEIEELARNDAWPTVWLDDAPDRVQRAAQRLGRPVLVHAYLDAGMGREGMPLPRARPWLERLCRSDGVRVSGTYMMTTEDLAFDREQVARFRAFAAEARAAGLELGSLHASPSFAVVHLPEARLDLVRTGNLLFGNLPAGPELAQKPELRTVFRLCARVVRMERFGAGDSASFGRSYIAKQPTWIALLPVGHTDGLPASAAGTCQVLIRGRLYPIVAMISSTHTIVEIGAENTVAVGDVATLIGPDHPEITPHVVAERCGMRFFRMISKFNARLPKIVV